MKLPGSDAEEQQQVGEQRQASTDGAFTESFGWSLQKYRIAGLQGSLAWTFAGEMGRCNTYVA